MSCYKPLQAYKKNNTGQVVFYDENGQFKPITIPCGRCIGCRIQRSKDWALRCLHEAQFHDENCFITLTYSPENLPPDCGLIKSDFRNFMKRFRRKISPKRIKFYMCGEYGERNNRPHYHSLIFGYNFDDWIYLFDSPGGTPVYTSPTLEKIWGLGFVTVGTLTLESAGYVARYCMKKINGKQADMIDPETGLKHYERINSFTGEISEVLPEYSNMSLGGRTGRGIGHNWISQYTSDLYPKDYTTVNGRRVPAPRYYDKYLNSIDPDMYDDIKAGRELNAYNSDDNQESRLLTREKVKEAQFQLLKRNL